jgi:parvulin-like peptidyl-prolyl isomerase
MTFRARPVVKRAQKPSWESRDRKNFYLNLGFGLVVVAALAILGIAVAFTYYTDHLEAVGSVGGKAISKDELRERVVIETWRLEQAQNQIRTQAAAGYLTAAQAEQQLQLVQQQRGQVIPIALERIIDNRIQADLAAAESIVVSEADIDARLAEEATTPETRHAWVIEVAPEISDDAIEPTEAQIEAARTKIDAALKDLQAGKAWDDIAKTVSTDTSTAAQAGDLGWLQLEDSQLDLPFVEALFAAEVDAPTAVIEGEDGIFRIGRVSEIVPEAVDAAAYQDSLVNGGIDPVKYREVIRGDVVRRKLEDKAIAEATKPGLQREVAEIYISAETAALPAEAVKVRHILYSPKDDPSAAQAGQIPETDPSWAAAKADADAAHAKVVADPTQFDAVARAESDEESALGETGTGGVLSAYVSADSSYVESFSKPILDAKPKVDQILPPIKTEFGYHVVQVLNHAPDLAAIKTQVDGGADFAQLARDLSEGAEASEGGDLGWVAKGQLDERLIAAIFETPIGKTSPIITIADDGEYLFKVTAEEERTPEGSQLETIEARAFSDWYTLKKNSVVVERDPRITESIG